MTTSTPAPFDYVIVGGGTAGLVVAARLSENPDCRVLVLEAGLDHSEDPRVRIPALYDALKYTDADWGFSTEPQPGLGGRRVAVNQGKALGGSSAINAHVFVPPAKGLVDAWETLGNPGWNWDTLRPYFAKAYTSPKVDKGLEKAMGISSDWSTGLGDARGPIQTSFPGSASHPIREAWAETFKMSGLAMAHDPFAGSSVGAFSCLASIDPATKERSYAATAYYHPIKHRDNLRVLTGARVLKIDFDRAAPPPAPVRATGVQYVLENGEHKTVAAAKEVVLAAGAFQSPKVLELSGIGDRQLLARHGIDVVLDLPGVGENLQDHVVCSIGYRARDDVETLDALARQEPDAVGQAMHEYAASRSGPLTSVGVYTYAYLPVPAQGEGPTGQQRLRDLLARHRPDDDDEESRPLACALHDLAERMLLDPEAPSGAYLSVVSQTPRPVEPGAGESGPPEKKAPEVEPGKFVTIGAMLSHPLSRGSVHIRSADPLADPAIDPRYLSHPLDEEVLARHLRHVDAVVAASPPLAGRVLRRPLERLRRDSVADDLDAAKRYLRAHGASMWHPAGSCAMLPRGLGGVVDARLLVHGVENVRVVDSSAIPLLSTANLQATVYAFAERAADIIKETWVR